MNINIANPDKLFFTSDTHFYHKNVIEYCNRPIINLSSNSDLEEMHRELIKNWNSIVPEDGIVFHLGDFAFTGQVLAIKELISKLNGKIYLIKGNHDIQNRYERESVSSLFAGVYDLLDVKVEDSEIDEGHQWLNLCHYPIESWSKKHRGSWHLHGHTHSGPYSTTEDRNMQFIANRYDVGVDNNDFKPISYNELKIIITKQNLTGEKV